MNQYSIDIQNVAIHLGHYFLDENNGNYDKTRQQILNLGITHMEFNPNNELVIYLTRPGLLIGKRGETISKISDYLLQKKIHILEENSINDYIIPRDVDEYLAY